MDTTVYAPHHLWLQTQGPSIRPVNLDPPVVPVGGGYLVSARVAIIVLLISKGFDLEPYSHVSTIAYPVLAGYRVEGVNVVYRHLPDVIGPTWRVAFSCDRGGGGGSEGPIAVGWRRRGIHEVS